MPVLWHAITRFIGHRRRAFTDLTDSVCTRIQGVPYAFPIKFINAILSVFMAYITRLAAAQNRKYQTVFDY
jgi:hypothetical protein